MYLIVRTDLKMSKGKIAAQCGHAVEWMVINNINSKSLNFCHPKIVLKVPDGDAMNSIAKYCNQNGVINYQVIDAGRIQVLPNTKTVLGIGPIKKSKVPTIIRELKLL